MGPRRRRTLVLALAGVVLASTSWAGPPEAPSGPVVLTVSGKVAKPNAGDWAVFDMAMLERLPQHSFTAKTPWYPQPRKFTGPLLRDVLAAAGAKGQVLKAVALNDYMVDIPFEDAQQHDVILARLLDDKPMPVREKGPLFIVYPFDSKPELRNAVYFSRSAWQLKAIQVQ
jgi:hypothetical protein